MKTVFYLMSAPLLMTGGSALAQEAAPAQQAPSAGAHADATEAAAPVEEEEVARFALAALVIQQIAEDESLEQEQQQSAMMQVVQEAGLAPQRFNEIARASQTDENLQRRISAAAAQHVEAAQQRNQ
jgi:hypothetical protein